jgi:hypothetical protein
MTYTWKDLRLKLWCGIPHWIVTWLDGKTKRTEKNWLTFLITLMILVLSAASITNLSDRAYHHHGNYSAYMAGFGLAALVPLAVICAVYVDVSGWTKAGIWTIASIFAVISAAIQVNIYAPTGLALDTGSLEAIAFGAGIPLAEILLATLDGILIQHFGRKTQAVKVEEKQAQAEIEAKAKADREEAEQKERERMEWQADQERKRQAWQAEQERVAAEHAQRLELQRQKEEAKLHKSVNQSVNSAVNKPSKMTDDTPVDSVNSAEVDTEKLLDFYKNNPASSLRKTGAAFGVSHTQIGKILKRMESDGLVSVNGVVKVL